VPSAYLFEEYIDEPVDAHEMVIAVADNPTGKRLPGDPLIGPTVRAIFYDFSSKTIRWSCLSATIRTGGSGPGRGSLRAGTTMKCALTSSS